MGAGNRKPDPLPLPSRVAFYATLPGDRPQKAWGILGDELPTFFTGQKSSEDVAALIQDKFNTLLNE